MSSKSKAVSKKEKAVAKKPVKEVESDEEEEEVPKTKKSTKQNGAKGKKETKKKPEPEPESESSEEEPEKESEEESSPAAEEEEEAEEAEEVPVLNKRKASDQTVGDEKRQKTAAGGTTVFVGRIADSVDDDKIKEFFSECGTITAVRWNIDRETGAFKGCGWIDFDTPEAAQKALEMAGAELEGKNVNIDLATPRGERPERAERGSAPEGNTVFIKNFGTEADEESIVAAINTVAEPTSYRLAKDRESGAFRGFGHFDFADSATAQKVVEGLNGYEFQGNNLAVEISAPRSGGFGGGRGGRGGRGGGFGGGRGGGFGGGRGGGFGGGRGGGFGGGRGGGFRGGRGGGGFGGGRGGGRGRF